MIYGNEGITKFLVTTLGLFFGVILSISADSVKLSWTAVGDDGYNGTASEYDLRYHTSVITEANFDLATRVLSVPRPQVAGARESTYIDGLEGGVRYYFALKVADERYNWSNISNVISKIPCPQGCIGIRGNIDNDMDEEITIGDLVYLVSYFFSTLNYKVPECSLETDVDGSGEINVIDLVYLVEYFFGDGMPPLSCP